MRRLILGLVFLLAGAVNAQAQSTTVTGNVTDAGSQAWIGGTCQFQIFLNPQFPSFPSYTWTGGALPQVVPCTLDGSGNYSASVPSSTAITPQGSKWVLQVTPNATSPSFSTPATTITGGSQTLNVTPPAIAIPWTQVGSPISAYSDSEIVGNIPAGAQYFNVLTVVSRIWNGTAWVNAGGGGGGGSISGGGTAGDIPVFTAAQAIGNSAWTDTLTTSIYHGTGGIGTQSVALTGVAPFSLSAIEGNSSTCLPIGDGQDNICSIKNLTPAGLWLSNDGGPYQPICSGASCGPPSSVNQLNSGGGVAWTGQGLVFTVSAANYTIAGTTYTTPQTNVTLAASDPTNPRIDVIAVDNTGTVVVLTGTPAPSPSTPVPNPLTQLALSAVEVAAGATTPVITNILIYDENVGTPTEWNCTPTANLNCNSTNNPYSFTHDIEATTAVAGNNAVLANTSTVNLATLSALSFNIRNKATWPAAKTISICFLNGSTTVVGNCIAFKNGVFGFNQANLTSYQQIVIPLAQFALTGVVDRVRFQVVGGGAAIGFYLDLIQIQSGNGGGASGSGTVSPGVIGEPAIYTATGTTVGPGTASVDASKFPGVDPTGATDSRAGLQAAITAAISSNSELFLPAGTYKTSANLSASSNAFRMRGAGVNVTSITASGTGYNTLTIGTGTGVVLPSGYLRDISLVGDGISNAGFSALQLNGVIQYEVDDVNVSTSDIGIDLINDCYGSQFSNIRGGFGGTLNVAVNLRTGSQSGSDLSFYNPWITGKIAAIYASGGGGGYHVWGGQVLALAPSLTDTSGAVVLGKDYLSGSTGETTMDFHGTSFEATTNAWIFRAYDQVHLTTYGVYLNPTNSGAPAIGVYKNANAKNSNIQFDGTTITGFWSNASLIVDSGGTSNDFFLENGTYPAASQPTINGTPTYVNSMVQQSGINYSVVTGSDFVNANAVTVNSLTSGRCVQTGTGGLLTTTSGACGTGSVAFNNITSGTNTTAAMICGTGCSLSSVPQFNVGAVSTAGVLGLVGSTSGTATFTAPAVAGTSTNPIVSSNILSAPIGSTAAASYGFVGTGGGLWSLGSGATVLQSINNNIVFETASNTAPWAINFSSPVAGEFQPGADNTTPIGDATHRVSNIFSNNGTFSSLTSGDCVQASTAGLLTTTALPCGTPAAGTISHGLVFPVGDPTNTTALTTAAVSFYVTVPFACTINAYNLAIDAGTITVKFWKVATGTAIPTSGNSINTSGVSIASGTAIHSATVTDFTTTTVTANDIIAMAVTAVSGAHQVTGVLSCAQ